MYPVSLLFVHSLENNSFSKGGLKVKMVIFVKGNAYRMSWFSDHLAPTQHKPQENHKEVILKLLFLGSGEVKFLKYVDLHCTWNLLARQMSFRPSFSKAPKYGA